MLATLECPTPSRLRRQLERVLPKRLDGPRSNVQPEALSASKTIFCDHLLLKSAPARARRLHLLKICGPRALALHTRPVQRPLCKLWGVQRQYTLPPSATWKGQ